METKCLRTDGRRYNIMQPILRWAYNKCVLSRDPKDLFNIYRSYLERRVCGSWMLSMIVLFLFHCDSTGLAAARMDVRALREQMIPALAMERVCCSMTSCITDRVDSLILSNSSIQQTPLSARTNAPLQVNKCKNKATISRSLGYLRLTWIHTIQNEFGANNKSCVPLNL